MAPAQGAPILLTETQTRAAGVGGRQSFERTPLGLWGEGKEGEGQGAAHTGEGLSWVIRGG